jgi:hypothetical protein
MGTEHFEFDAAFIAKSFSPFEMNFNDSIVDNKVGIF